MSIGLVCTARASIAKGIVKKFLKARKSSETLGNARERSRGFASKGDKAIVVECVNNGISAYRRVTDRSAAMTNLEGSGLSHFGRGAEKSGKCGIVEGRD